MGYLNEIRARLDASLNLSDGSDASRAKPLAVRALALSHGDDPAARDGGQARTRGSSPGGDQDAQTTAPRALGEAARNDVRNAAAVNAFLNLR